jgi:hypothetical protein
VSSGLVRSGIEMHHHHGNHVLDGSLEDAGQQVLEDYRQGSVKQYDENMKDRSS